MDEIWKDVVGYEGFYSASNLGRIKSNDRIMVVKRGKSVFEKRCSSVILTGAYDPKGYLTVSLSVKNKIRTKRIHRLVCEAFHGKKIEGMIACHNNGNKQDNRADNLRWGTHKSNQDDRILHGTDLRGELVKTSKFTADQIRKIKYDLTAKQAEIEFGASKSHAWRIKKGDSWAHI